MQCCGRDVTGLELQVKGQPYVLFRCPACQTNHWSRDEEPIEVGELTEALQGETRERAASKAARHRSRGR